MKNLIIEITNELLDKKLININKSKNNTNTNTSKKLERRTKNALVSTEVKRLPLLFIQNTSNLKQTTNALERMISKQQENSSITIRKEISNIKHKRFSRKISQRKRAIVKK